MTKRELWSIYARDKPHWMTSGPDLTPAGFRKLFDQIYDLAHAAGKEEGGRAEREKDEPVSPSAFDEILRSMGLK